MLTWEGLCDVHYCVVNSNLKKCSFLCNTLRYLTIDMFSLDALVLDQLNLMTMIEIILMKLAVNDFLAT